MAKMDRNGWKWLKRAENGWKWMGFLDMTKMAGNG